MVKEISPKELNELMEKKALFLLDIRKKESVQKSPFETKNQTPALNISFFDMVEGVEKENRKEAIKEYVQSRLTEKLPKDEEIVVVCAEGNSSSMVAGVLTDLDYSSHTLEGGISAWGDFYDRKTIYESKELTIYQIIRVAKGCLSYVLVSNREAAVIDPLRNIQPYLDLFKELDVKPKWILDTHAHADHISGGKELGDKLNIPYTLHPYDGIHPMDILPAEFSYEPSWKDKTYSLGSITLKALHIPGHTLGNQAFLLNDSHLFTGDSIFIGSIARPDLGGQAETWTKLHYESLQQLLSLPKELIILPAHFGSYKESNEDFSFHAPLKNLLETNEGLKMAQKPLEEFTNYILSNLPHFPEEYIEIKRVNLGLSKPDEKKASELEMGKNVCAVGK